MYLIKRNTLQELIETEGDHHVSLYMPTHPFGREQQQDPIRFGNLYSKMVEQLDQRGMRKPERDDFLEELNTMTSSNEFWQNNSDGLAIFVAGDGMRVFRVPISFESQVFVGDHFMIDALLPAMSKGQKFFILALSQADIRLFQGNRYGIGKIDLGDTPTSIEEAIWADERERQLQFHSETHSPGGESASASGFHGHAVLDESQKTDIRRFFQEVDAGLMDILAEENAPLVIAGVEYLMPIFREVSEYPNITEEAIAGNPDDTQENTLHAAAWKIAAPQFEKLSREAIARSEMLLGSDSALVSTDFETIIPAAYYGRIDTLMIPEKSQVWGLLNPEDHSFSRHETFLIGDVNLVNTAAMQALINSGDVFMLEKNEMPKDAEICAIFRYGLDGENDILSNNDQ